MTKLIHAFTPPVASYPPYINISRLADGSVKLIVRTDASVVGLVSEIVLSEADWRSLAWSAFAEANDHELAAGRSGYTPRALSS